MSAKDSPLLAGRRPYVGTGADGARRSAQIDREEADSLPRGRRRGYLEQRASAWDRLADELERQEDDQ